MIDFSDETRYLDLGKHFSDAKAYQDWEGFADGVKVKERLDRIWEKSGSVDGYTEHKEVLYTLCLHFFYSLADTFSLEEEDVSDQEMHMVVEAYNAILGTRYFLKETAT